MRLLTKRLLQTACVGASVFTLALGPTRADAQGGCAGHRGMSRGGSPGMMGGGGMGGGMGSRQGMMGPMGQGMGGMGGMGRGGMGGMGSQQGMMGPMGQGMGGMGGQSNMAQRQGMMADMHIDQNDPAAVLAHKDDLSLTKEQVQRLEKMLKSGKKRAAPLLNKEQKKKLQELVSAADHR